MAKKWRTSIRKLLHKNKSPSEQQVSPTQETCHISSKEPQREEKLRWESFENKLAQRMGSAVLKNAADEESGLGKEVAKSLSLQEIRGRSVIDDDLAPISDNVVGKTFLTSTIDDKNITRLLNTSSIQLNETGRSKRLFKKSLVEAEKRKPPASDSVSLKSSARSESMGLTSTSDDNDITLISTLSVQLNESGPSKVVAQNSSAKSVTEKPPQSDFVSLKSFARSASSATKASTKGLSESDSTSPTSFARSASIARKAYMNKASDRDSVSLKSPAESTSSTAMAATKQPSKSIWTIRESPTRSQNSIWEAFANNTFESGSVTGKLRASSTAMAVTKRPSKSDSVSLKSPARSRRSPTMPVMERLSEVVSATLPSTIRSTIITVTEVTEKPFTSGSSSLKSPAGSASTTSSETTSSTNDSPSMDTDSISYHNTDFSGSYSRERLQSFLDDDVSSYTRERLRSFLDEDESSLVTGSYTHSTLDDESITGGIFERAVLRVGLLFLCNLTEDDRCSSVKHG